MNLTNTTGNEDRAISCITKNPAEECEDCINTLVEIIARMDRELTEKTDLAESLQRQIDNQ